MSASHRRRRKAALVVCATLNLSRVTCDLVLLRRVAYRGRVVNGPRLRWLLALLAGDLRSGRHTAHLVDRLWPDVQPQNPSKALHILVSRLRQQLGRDVIVTTPGGYRLALREDQIDATALAAHAAECARHARADDHRAALASAEAGLALWSGGSGDNEGHDRILITDASPESGTSGSRDPLSELRADCASTCRLLWRARALALAGLGRHGEALEALTPLATENPRDEEILAALLRCEAATVSPAAALQRYERYRRSLRDELGADPGVALQELHRQLLQAGVPAVRRGVPYEPNPLLGRADDIAAVTELLRSSRVTSIVGPGGLGKTRLAYAVSRQAEQRVVHAVSLAGVTSDADVVAEVASTLGVSEPRRGPVVQPSRPVDSAASQPGMQNHVTALPDQLASIVSALDRGPSLLVMDNCEHVLDGVAMLVRALVAMTEDVRILTTSRAPLGLSSEAVYLLPELDLATSVELFTQRARSARPGVELPADAVTELCRRLDGLPLAVELAAARVRVMSVAEVVRRLDDRFALLRNASRDAPERHHTLHAVVEWSWNLLEPGARAAMRALSVFPGGFTADAARHMLTGRASGAPTNVDAGDVTDVLQHLVDQSLLKVTDTSTGVRFSMLETIREFSVAQRDRAGETPLMIQRFLSWARDFGLACHGGEAADFFACVRRIQDEQENIVQALRDGLACEDARTVAAATAVLAWLSTMEGNYTRMIWLAEKTAWLLSHFRPDARRAPELVEITRTAAVLCAMSTFELHGPRATRWLILLRRLPPASPRTLIGATAIVLNAVSRREKANTCEGGPEAVLLALCNSGEPLVAGLANWLMSYVFESSADPDRALEAGRQALDRLGDCTSPWMRVVVQSRAGELCLHAERGEEAVRYLGAALRILEGGDWPDVLQIRWTLALAHLQTGDVDQAERLLQAAAQDGMQAPAVRPVDLGVRAEICLSRGDVEGGLALWRRAIDEQKAMAEAIARTDGVDGHTWELDVEAVCVIAHAWHDRIDLVAELVRDLPDKLSAMLAGPVTRPFVTPTCGALLLATGLADLVRAAQVGDERAKTLAVRMLALAERCHFPRQFHPTLSAARVRRTAEEADRATYRESVCTYKKLDVEDLRDEVLALLRARSTSHRMAGRSRS